MSLPGKDRALLAEAAGSLILASLRVALLPFRRVAQRSAAGLAGLPAADAETIAAVAGAVTRAARHLPTRAVCIEQGLAAQAMLRRRGFGSTLCYGAARDAERGLAAHVWVRSGTRDVVGCEDLARFALIASFPPSGAAAVLHPDRSEDQQEGGEAQQIEPAALLDRNA